MLLLGRYCFICLVGHELNHIIFSPFDHPSFILQTEQLFGLIPSNLIGYFLIKAIINLVTFDHVVFESILIGF